MTAWPAFGAAVENLMAGVDNPQRVGYFVRRVDRRGRRMNAGIWWELTDRKGDFWLTNPANCRPAE